MANFVSTLKDNSSNDIKLDSFIFGKRHADQGGFRALFLFFGDVVRLMTLLKTQKYDLYHLNPSFKATAVVRDLIFSIILSTYSNGPIICFFHGWSRSFHHFVKTKCLLKFFFTKGYQRNKLFIVLAQTFKKDLIELGIPSEKILVLSTMFDKTLFEDVRNLINSPKAKTRNILFLSRIIKEKGIFELINGFREALHILPDLTLTIAGTGIDLPELQKYTSKHQLLNKVFFPGYLRGKDKIHAFYESDLFILPSYAEGCPVSLLEAMAAGLPIITFPVGGIPDVIKDNINGVHLRKINSSEISSAIVKIFSNPSFQKKIRDQNFNEAWEKYESSLIIQKLEACYRNLLGEKAMKAAGTI